MLTDMADLHLQDMSGSNVSSKTRSIANRQPPFPETQRRRSDEIRDQHRQLMAQQRENQQKETRPSRTEKEVKLFHKRYIFHP